MPASAWMRISVVAVAALVEQRQRRARAGRRRRSRRSRALLRARRRRQQPVELGAKAGARVYRAGRRRRGRKLPRSRPRKRRGVGAHDLGAVAEPELARRCAAAAPTSVSTSVASRRAARERLDRRARRCRRRGRARARPRRRRGSRRAPRGRGRAVGRTVAARGARSRRPPSSPATILTGLTRRSAPRARRRSAPGRRRAAGRAPGASSEPCSREQRDQVRAGGARAARRPRAGVATRNRGRPLWRVPSTSPSPRSARSTSASSKPSRSRAIASSRSRARSDSGSAKRMQWRLVLAAADPAAQLVELAEPVAVGVLDQHHARVGDVDPDLDHAGRDEHLRLAGGEARHRRRLLGGGHLAVQDLDLEVRRTRPPRAARPRRSPPSPAAFSDSETSGQTTKAWRPSRSRSRMNP